jgi:hypothetical protein
VVASQFRPNVSLLGPITKEFDVKNPLATRASFDWPQDASGCIPVRPLAPAADGAVRYSANDALWRLERLLETRDSTTLTAVVLGAVHYGQGDGIALEVQRGIVHLEVTCTDTVLSWDDDKYRVQAAIPYANFSHYVTSGAIRLAI